MGVPLVIIHSTGIFPEKPCILAYPHGYENPHMIAWDPGWGTKVLFDLQQCSLSSMSTGSEIRESTGISWVSH